MKVNCVACGNEFDSLDSLASFVKIPKNNGFFILCKDDLKRVVEKLLDMRSDQKAYMEHKEWYLKQKKLLKLAKQIFKKCHCKGKFSEDEIDSMDEEIYDRMCEECWKRFSANEDSVNTPK